MNERTRTTTFQAIEIGSKVLFFVATLFVAIVAYEGRTLIQSMHDHEVRIGKIEANRYSSKDALQDMRVLNKSINDLKTWIEVRYPPQWLKTDVAELRTDVGLMKTEVQSLRSEIQHLIGMRQ